MSGKRTFADAADRERYELDHLADAEEAIADHETRITTLEGGTGSGGGMAETMWAHATCETTFSPSGPVGTTPPMVWSEGSLFAVGVEEQKPFIDPGDDTFLVTTSTGYHLLRVDASVADTAGDPGGIAATERYIAVVTVYGGLGVRQFQFPLTVGLNTPRYASAYALTALHLVSDGDTTAIRAAITYDGSAATERLGSVEVGLSRIGANVTDVDPDTGV